MARLPAILAIALTASFAIAGCADAGPEGSADDATPTPGLDDAPTTGGSSVTTSRELGAVSGSNVQPSRFDFTVEVPAGGARNVHWSMTIEASGNSVVNHVEGPGCSASVTSFTVLGSNTFGGGCDDLGAGSHTFTAVLGSPAVAFEASVQGQVTVVSAS
jgi:hypothetical protein